MAIDEVKLQDGTRGVREPGPGYRSELVCSWIAALEGVQAKLEAGARVADVGCGQGGPTLLLAQAFPRSQFVGYDNHAPSILAARQAASRAGVIERAYFREASAVDFPGWNYDLITCFDCLRELANPVGAARRVLSSLQPDGTWMIVEPRAGERGPCRGVPLAGDGAGLGTSARAAKVRDLARAAGFSRFRCVCESPLHSVFEVRP